MCSSDLREHALQVGPQRLDLRRQPRLRLALRPQQLVAKGREPRRLAFFPQHQRMPEFLLPALELAPHVPVREAQRLRAGGDGAAAADTCSRLISGLWISPVPPWASSE